MARSDAYPLQPKFANVEIPHETEGAVSSRKVV